MKLSIEILSMLNNVYASKISAHGLATPVSVNFNPRSGSTTSHIANLPKSLIALGTATNITIPTVELVVGATLEKESVRGKSVLGNRNISGSGFVPRYGVNEKNQFEMFEVAPNGDKRSNLVIDNPALCTAFENAQAFLEYMEILSAHVKALAVYNAQKSAVENKKLTIKNALAGLKSEDEINAIVESITFDTPLPVLKPFVE